MSFPKLIFLGAISLFLVIGVTAVIKKSSSKSTRATNTRVQSVQTPIARAPVAPQPAPAQAQPAAVPVKLEAAPQDNFPMADRIHLLFTTGPGKLPIVETVTYNSKYSSSRIIDLRNCGPRVSY